MGPATEPAKNSEILKKNHRKKPQMSTFCTNVLKNGKEGISRHRVKLTLTSKQISSVWRKGPSRPPHS